MVIPVVWRFEGCSGRGIVDQVDAGKGVVEPLNLLRKRLLLLGDVFPLLEILRKAVLDTVEDVG